MVNPLIEPPPTGDPHGNRQVVPAAQFGDVPRATESWVEHRDFMQFPQQKMEISPRKNGDLI